MPQHHAPHQACLRVVVRDRLDGPVPERLRLAPIAARFGREGVNPVALQRRQRPEGLLELRQAVRELRQQVEAGAPDLGLRQISLLEQEREQRRGTAARRLGRARQEARGRCGQPAHFRNEGLLRRVSRCHTAASTCPADRCLDSLAQADKGRLLADRLQQTAASAPPPAVHPAGP